MGDLGIQHGGYRALVQGGGGGSRDPEEGVHDSSLGGGSSDPALKLACGDPQIQHGGGGVRKEGDQGIQNGGLRAVQCLSVGRVPWLRYMEGSKAPSWGGGLQVGEWGSLVESLKRG